MKLNFNYKYNFKIIFVCILIVFSGIYYNYYIKNNYNSLLMENINILDKKIELENIKNINVEISGNVNYPGIYSLKNNNTLDELIYRAGGLKNNINNINKIYFDIPLFDGENIFIDDNSQVHIYYSKNINENILLDDIETPKDVTLSKGININTASKELLMILPNIGESLSDRIIDYRNKNNGFKSIDEVKNIKGIGEKKFEEIKNYIILE